MNNSTWNFLDSTNQLFIVGFTPFPRPERWGFWFAVYMTPIIVTLGLTGNTLTFIVMKSKHLRRRSYSHLLCSLAVFDSLNLIGRQTDMINRYRIEHLKMADMYMDFSDFGCKIYSFFLNVSYMMSSWLIVCMSLERVQAVCFPFRNTVMRTQKGAVGIIVCLCIILSLTQTFRFLYYGRVHGTCGAYNEHLRTYLAWHIYGYMFILIFALPFIIVLASNCAVIYKINQARRDIEHINSGDMSVHTSHVDRTKQTTYTLLVITSSYIVTMLPLLIITVVLHVSVDLNKTDSIYLYITLLPYSEVASTLSYFNYSVNFFIYVLSGQSFRRELSKLFTRTRSVSSNTRTTRDERESRSGPSKQEAYTCSRM